MFPPARRASYFEVLLSVVGTRPNFARVCRATAVKYIWTRLVDTKARKLGTFRHSHQGQRLADQSLDSVDRSGPRTGAFLPRSPDVVPITGTPKPIIASYPARQHAVLPIYPQESVDTGRGNGQ